MAMLRDPLSHEATLECPRSLDPLCGVQPQVAIHSKEGKPKLRDQDPEPCNGEANASATSTSHVAMQKKIEAEETLMTAIQKEVEIKESSTQGYAKAKASPTRTSPPTVSPTSR